MLQMKILVTKVGIFIHFQSGSEATALYPRFVI